MSYPKKIVSGKTGAKGFLYRYTDPTTKRVTEKRFYVSEKSLAEELFREHMNDLQTEAVTGTPRRTAARKLCWSDLVTRFLKEEPITSETRRNNLKRVLEANELELETAADLISPNNLTTRCIKLLESKKRDAVYIVGTLQRDLRQVRRWASEDASILPPLKRWRKLPFKFERQKRRAFKAEEVKAILRAASELDETFGRSYPLELVLRTLVTCGNRPGVVCNAKILDLHADRIALPPGDGKKRNGAATLPAELVQELRLYTRNRPKDGPLLVSADGSNLDLINLCRRDFRLAAMLAFVREIWPAADSLTKFAEPLEVASTLLAGGDFKVDGRMPIDAEKLNRRQKRIEAVNGLAQLLKPEIDAKLAGRDLYAFTRKTHVTLARAAGVNRDDVDFQVGHTNGDVSTKHYTDETLFSPQESSSAVYALIAPRRISAEEPKVIRLAAGAESEAVLSVAGENEAQNSQRGQKSVTQVKAARSVIKSHLWDLNPGPMLYEPNSHGSDFSATLNHTTATNLHDDTERCANEHDLKLLSDVSGSVSHIAAHARTIGALERLELAQDAENDATGHATTRNPQRPDQSRP